jgi:hypothetical protein
MLHVLTVLRIWEFLLILNYTFTHMLIMCFPQAIKLLGLIRNITFSFSTLDNLLADPSGRAV